MNANVSAAPTTDSVELANQTIRDLVERHPAILSVLAPHGIDLCCGGSHQLGEALDLHGIDRQQVLAHVARVIASSNSGQE